MLHIAARFAAARDSVQFAQDATTELGLVLRTFFQRDVAIVVVELDPKTGEQVQKLRLVEALPREARRKATEALSNARNAFDQAAYAARLLGGQPRRKSVYYPWASDPRDLEHLLENRRFDQRLRETFRAHEPYGRAQTHPGGNDLIRSLAQLANTKHTVGLSVRPEVHSVTFGDVRGRGIERLRLAAPHWDPVKNEAELIRWIGDLDTGDQQDIELQVVLEKAVSAQPVDAVAALRAFADKAQAVVESLQARCLEIGG